MTSTPMISAKALGGMPQFVLAAAGEKRLSRAFDRADLPELFIDDRTGYISERSLAAFVHEAARSVGQQNIGLMWSPYLTVADYGAWGQYVLSAPTLGAALRRASSVMPFHSTADRTWLEVVGEKRRLCYHFGLKSHLVYPEIGFSAIGALLSIFRAYLGSRWRPDAILFDFPKVPSAAEAEDTYGCPVQWDAARLAIEFQPWCLAARGGVPGRKMGTATVQDIARERSGGPPRSVHDQVVAVTLHQLNRNDVSLEATARALGLGVRTLQRKLDGEGARYRDVVNSVRVGRARELLEQTGASISDIASALGYETANNFSRAFKTATGLSPSDFRRQILQRPNF